METTRLSTKGQIILPKAIRVSWDWKPGTEFTVEETAEGILLRPAARFPAARLDEVRLPSTTGRKPKTPARMGAVVAREVQRRNDRGRY